MMMDMMVSDGWMMMIHLLFCYEDPLHTYSPWYDAKVESRPQEVDVILPSAW